MRVLVTGHNGYIGRVLCEVFVQSGVEIVGLDNFYYAEHNPVGTRRDIRDTTEMVLESVDAIVHLAALSNDPIGHLNPRWTHEINYQASIKLAESAKKVGIDRFLYASSCSIYGHSGDEESVNEESPLAPLTEYALSKIQTEQGLTQLADSNFCPVFLRNATAYGVSPNLRLDLVVNNLAAWAYTTGKIKIMSDGTAWRPVVHVQDIAAAFLATLKAPREGIFCQAFNVGSNSDNYRVNELASILREITGCKIELHEGGSRDPRSYRVDFSKIKRHLPGYKTAWDVREGVNELLNEYQNCGLTFEQFQGRKYIRIEQLEYLIQNYLLDDDLRWKDTRHD
jgi:nucleoside-diphosphate-sugar epimerase